MSKRTFGMGGIKIIIRVVLLVSKYQVREIDFMAEINLNIF